MAQLLGLFLGCAIHLPFLVLFLFHLREAVGTSSMGVEGQFGCGIELSLVESVPGHDRSWYYITFNISLNPKLSMILWLFLDCRNWLWVSNIFHFLISQVLNENKNGFQVFFINFPGFQSFMQFNNVGLII